jgi:hypothetical protein
MLGDGTPLPDNASPRDENDECAKEYEKNCVLRGPVVKIQPKRRSSQFA